MKLHSPKDMGQMSGVCCRQSPLRGAVGGLVLGAAFIGVAGLCKYSGFPWPVWGGCAVVAALVVPFILLDVLAKFRASNWLVWVRPDGLWINLRSYQNHHLPEAATVLHLSYGEVARAHRHTETWTTPSEPNSLASTHWRQESLDLHLASGDAGPVVEALIEERNRAAPQRVLPGGVRVSSKGPQQSVTVPEEGVVRLAWRGAGHGVVPSLARVLDELSHHVEVAEPTRLDRPDWNKLSDAELDELVARLVRSGETLDASQLLMRRRGYSATEAHKFLEELGTRI